MQIRRRFLWIALAILLLFVFQGRLRTAFLPTSDPRAGTYSTSLPLEEEATGEGVYLSDLTWVSGSTGWVAMANDDLPALDRSFDGYPLSIAGTEYTKGLGVYPLSEIAYALDGQYAVFESEIGLNDLPNNRAEAEPSRVVFSVFLNGALAYDSGVVTRGQLPLQVRLAMPGVRDLRLVVSAAGPPSVHNFANWANARLVRSTDPIDEETLATNLTPLREQVAGRAQRRSEDRRAVAALAERALEEMSGESALVSTPSTEVVALETDGKVILLNGIVALSYPVGGELHGLMSALHVPSGQLLIHETDASVTVNGTRLSIHHDTSPARRGGVSVVDVQDPLFGSGKRLAVGLRAKNGEYDFTLALTLFEAQPYFVQEITVDRAPAMASDLRINHFDSLGPANLAIAEDLRYLTDITRLRTGLVQDDGIQRRETVDQGKPVYLSSEAAGLGLLLAPIDETVGPIEVALQVDHGKVLGRLDLITGHVRKARDARPAGPRLYVEVVPSGQARQAFANFRTFIRVLYPPAQLPEWVRYQWLSWYTYYMDIDEQRIRRQIDFIAANLADLGPWHIIVDAGWYVAEGRPDADWRNVDRLKFPSGLRALVDYAHDRNVRVVLYFSAPYLDSRSNRGDWLGLRGLIDRHPQWLIPLGDDETHQSFVYDLESPELRGYLAEVMRDYFEAYDVDGIKIDGLGNAEGAVVDRGERDAFGLVGKVRDNALDIYRFVREQATRWKPEAYIESGWLDPVFAAGLAHTFRYGDEGMAFSNRYPQPGLVEHIDYAIAQQSLWGQRANMGAVYADPNEAEINEQWLAASLALGAQSVLAFDLPTMSPETLSRYRSLLVHYRPFAGETFYADIPGIEVFATTKDGISYLGILNRYDESRSLELRLAAIGLASGTRYLSFDLTHEQFSLTEDAIPVKLGPRSFRLFLLREQAGVMWTNSSFELLEDSSSKMVLDVRGPAALKGFLQVFIPDFDVSSGVLLDGQPLTQDAGEDRRYSYDDRLGLLTVWHDNDQPHRIETARRARR